MAIKINLLVSHHERINFLSVRSKLRTTIFVLLTVMSLAGGSLYIYWYRLTNRLEDMSNTLVATKLKIDAHRGVEQEKSLISLKVTELKQIARERFDYVTAIDDVQKLFGYSLEFDTISIIPDGTVTVKAQKKQELKLPDEQVFITNIKKIELVLRVASAEELEEVIDNLRVFHGAGLSGATVVSTSRLTEGGYEVNLLIHIVPDDTG